MKKLLCFVIVLLLAFTVFVSCGDDDTTSSTSADSSAAASADTSAKTTDSMKTDDTTTNPTGDTTTEKPEDTTEPGGSFEFYIPELDENTVDLFAVQENLLRNIVVEDKHAELSYHPALVFSIDGDKEIYEDILGEERDQVYWTNPEYQWILKVNGEMVVPELFTIYATTDWGYFRCDLGPVESYNYVKNKFSFLIELFIIDVDTWTVAYYANFAEEKGALDHRTGFAEAENRPDGLAAIKSVTCMSGPDMGANEGAQKAFDKDFKTKLCTTDNDTPILVYFGGQKTIKGISLVNANDNESMSGRTVTNFEVWVSNDGENWGTAPAWSTDGAGIDKNTISQNYQEIYYGFDTPITASYIKLVINNGERYQFCEALFYEDYDPNSKPVTLLPLEDTSIDLHTVVSFRDIAIEDKHAAHNNNPAFVFQLTGNGEIYQDILGDDVTDKDHWTNPKYKWILSVNGEYLEPLGFSVYTWEDHGYFRCDLGHASNYEYKDLVFYYSIDLYIVDAETGKVVYYALFSQNGAIAHTRRTIKDSGMIEDADKPSDLTPVMDVMCESGPDMGGKEGLEKAFDLSEKTKLCTKDNDTPIIVRLPGEKTLKGISLVNANDNASSNSRTVTAFEVWVSTDGENWGTAAAWSTDGAGIDKSTISQNYQENYYGFDTPITATYVKLVINNGGLYQFSEVVFYE